MGAVSSAVSGFAQYKQGQAQQAAYDYNANVTLEQMKEHEETSEAQYANLMGRQRALYAKAGVDITSGSPLLIAAFTAAQATEEQQRIQYSGETEADLERYYGKVAASSATTGAMSTFLTGLGRSGMQYAWANKNMNINPGAAYNTIYGPGGVNPYMGP